MSRRKTPKRYRKRIPLESKLELARVDFERALSAVFVSVGKLANARDLVRYYERKLGVEPARVVASAALAQGVEDVKKEANHWLEHFGFEVKGEGGLPEKKKDGCERG